MSFKTNSNGTFYYSSGQVLKEKAASPIAGTSTTGTLWLRDDNSLMFTDQANVDYVIGGAAVPSSATNVISPAQITSNQNDYNPTGFSSANVVRLDLSADFNISGFSSLLSSDVVIKKIINIGSGTVTLKHQSTNSVAANRILIPGYADLPLFTDDCVDIFYDITTQRWRVC